MSRFDSWAGFIFQGVKNDKPAGYISKMVLLSFVIGMFVSNWILAGKQLAILVVCPFGARLCTRIAILWSRSQSMSFDLVAPTAEFSLRLS